MPLPLAHAQKRETRKRRRTPGGSSNGLPTSNTQIVRHGRLRIGWPESPTKLVRSHCSTSTGPNPAQPVGNSPLHPLIPIDSLAPPGSPQPSLSLRKIFLGSHAREKDIFLGGHAGSTTFEPKLAVFSHNVNSDHIAARSAYTTTYQPPQQSAPAITQPPPPIYLLPPVTPAFTLPRFLTSLLPLRNNPHESCSGTHLRAWFSRHTEWPRSRFKLSPQARSVAGHGAVHWRALDLSTALGGLPP